jgi:hypothetical membrane protein
VNINKIIYKFTGTFGLLLPIIFSLVMLISILQNQWFSWTEHAVSDLGKADASPLIFNNGLIIIGIFLLIFSLGLIKSFEKNRGPIIIFMCSFLLMAIGLFPVPNILHEPFSMLFFISFSIAFLAIGIGIFNKSQTSFLFNMKVLAFFVPIAAIFSFIFFFFYNWIAISEILVIYPGFIWCMIYSVRLLGNNIDSQYFE